MCECIVYDHVTKNNININIRAICVKLVPKLSNFPSNYLFDVFLNIHRRSHTHRWFLGKKLAYFLSVRSSIAK